MFLDPLRIALQGLGFPLSPIAMAVQGFIAELQEEAQRLEYHGGGGRQRGASAYRGRQEEAAPERRPLGEAEVRAQWELLELRRENQRLDALAREARQTRKTPAPAPAVALAQAEPAPGQAEAVAAQAADQADTEARESLLLLLALA